MKTLTPDQQYMVNQVIASMAIEDMPVPEETKQSLNAIACGDKTIEDALAELEVKYRE